MTRHRTRVSLRARLGLLAIGLAVVVVAEGVALLVLALLGPSADPNAAASGSVAPFVRGRTPDGREMWAVHPARRHWFPDQKFPVHRSDSAILVFCLGGSSVYGYPHGAEFAFAYRLQEALRRGHPELEIDVVNNGGMSYGSERLRRLAVQLMDYRPDLVVVYTGHNEFVERDAGRSQPTGLGGRAAARFRRLAIYRVAERLLVRPRPAATDSMFGIDVQRREVRAVQTGEVETAADSLRANLEDIARLVRDRGGIPVLCTVASNLASWRPENSAMDRELGSEAVLRVAILRARARSHAGQGDDEAAVAELQSAIAIDPGYAELDFETALVLRRLGRPAEARRLFEVARDHDPTPIRAPSLFNEAVRDAARATRAVLVDVESAIADAATDGIPGNELFLDYCHPTAAGHDLIAGRLVRRIEQHLGLPLSNPPPLLGTEAAPASRETDSGFALWWRGNVELRQGRARTAERLLRRAADLKPSSERPLVSLSQALKAQGRTQEALEASRRAVDLAPESVMALSSLGVLLGQMGDSDQALELLQRALAFEPDAAWVHVNVAAEFLRRRDPDAALRHLEHAVRLHPNIRGAFRNIGLAQLLRGDREAATAAFVEELRRSPFDLQAAVRLAETAAEIDSLEIARAAAELASVLDPDNPRVEALFGRLSGIDPPLTEVGRR